MRKRLSAMLVLAVLTGVLIFRGPGLFGESGDLPSADDIRTRVVRSVREMKSLKTTFELQKLNLYRVGREGGSLLYNFANGTFDGHVTYGPVADANDLSQLKLDEVLV